MERERERERERECVCVYVHVRDALVVDPLNAMASLGNGQIRMRLASTIQGA